MRVWVNICQNGTFGDLILHTAVGQQVSSGDGSLAHHADCGSGVRIGGVSSSVDVVVAAVYVTWSDEILLLLTGGEDDELLLFLGQGADLGELGGVPVIADGGRKKERERERVKVRVRVALGGSSNSQVVRATTTGTNTDRDGRTTRGCRARRQSRALRT